MQTKKGDRRREGKPGEASFGGGSPRGRAQEKAGGAPQAPSLKKMLQE